jgi:excisionase family DNA binding protein
MPAYTIASTRNTKSENRMQQEQILLRPIEAAKALGCSRTRVYELVHAGDLPHVRLGGTSIRIPRAAIEKLVRDAMTQNSDER